jgi:hypothetical protein
LWQVLRQRPFFSFSYSFFSYASSFMGCQIHQQLFQALDPQSRHFLHRLHRFPEMMDTLSQEDSSTEAGQFLNVLNEY